MNVRPESAVRARVGGWGAAGAVLGLVSAWWAGAGTAVQWIALLAGAAFPMWCLEWRKGSTTEGGADRKGALLGVAVITALQAVVLSLQLSIGGDQGAAVAFALPLLPVAGLALLIVAALCPQVLGETVPATGRVFVQLAALRCPDAAGLTALLGWCVKCFFLPLMLGWSWSWLAGLEYRLPEERHLHLYIVGMALLYAVDTAFGVIGYVSTARCLGGEIRSVDRTLLGWGAALACYPPLSVLVLDTWLISRNAHHWRQWLDDGSAVSILWGGSILLLTAIYTWSTVAFGLRFSNLTHRGVITHGPYRWSKHPAYISKNLSWWLISVPFLTTAGVRTAIVSCLAMLAVNAVYWLRARTEERHLRNDPVYREYSAWIAREGLLAWCRRRGR